MKEPHEYRIGCDCKDKHDILYCDNTCGKFKDKLDKVEEKNAHHN